MYVRDGANSSAFDGIAALDGKFKFNPSVDEAPVVEVTMVYVNSKTRTTYGSCPFSTFSPKTREAFRAFLESAEQDFGEVVFEGGVVSPFGHSASASGKAESNEGLPKGLGQE